jgi:phosphoserine phosphatase RsbU/P
VLQLDTAATITTVKIKRRHRIVQEISGSTQHAGPTADPLSARPEVPATPPAAVQPAVRPFVRAAEALVSPLKRLAELLLLRPGPCARAFDNLIVALIVLSVASIAVEAIPGLPPWAMRALHAEELVVVTVFSIEYLLRIVAAPAKLAFIFSFAGLVDLLAIAPFFLTGLDVRWLRVLRLLRLLRVLKLQTHILESTVAERTRQLAEKNASLEEAQAQIKAELDVARALQTAILPARFPATPQCDGAARMLPATTMCGDFYDFIELADGRIGVVIADVSGHGVPAAFFMAVARTSLRDFAAHHADPGTCLAYTNRALCRQNPMDLFVTVFYCVLDPRTGVLRYANGGHNPPYLRRAGGQIEALDGRGGLVLGVLPEVKFPEHTLQLRPGDRLVLYTDGVTEACNAAEELYGTERLIAQLSDHGDATATAVIEGVCESVRSFCGTAAQADDITLTVLAWTVP